MANDYISKIEDDLNTVEVRVIAEFKSNSMKLTGSDIGGLADEFRQEIHYVLDALREALEHTGSEDHLELTTARHEEIRERLYVVNQLLDRQIAMNSFNEAQRVLEILSRQQGYNPVSEKKPGKPRVAMTPRQSQGLMDSIRGMFGRKAAAASGIRIAETAPRLRKNIYQAGPFGAAHELAMLAVMADVKPPVGLGNAVTQSTAKAQFESRDIDSEMDHLPELREKSSKPDIARSPEAIRAKLEARKNLLRTQGKAKFESRELSSDIHRESQIAAKPGAAGKARFRAIDPDREDRKEKTKRGVENPHRLSIKELKPEED